jgi:hypothetical protein
VDQEAVFCDNGADQETRQMSRPVGLEDGRGILAPHQQVYRRVNGGKSVIHFFAKNVSFTRGLKNK